MNADVAVVQALTRKIGGVERPMATGLVLPFVGEGNVTNVIACVQRGVREIFLHFLLIDDTAQR